MNNTSDIEANFPNCYHIIQLYYASYIWVLAAFGVPGNVACIFTVASMTLTTATLYVVLLAAADLAALVLKLIYHQMYHHKVPTHTLLCKGDVLVQVVSCYANWALVLICFERFLAVCYPMKRNAYFTKKRAMLIAVSLGITLCLCYLYPFIQFIPTTEQCKFSEYALEFVNTYWYWIASSIYFFLPFILITIFTCLIIVSLMWQKKPREVMCSTTQTITRETSQTRVEQAICIMMVCAAIVFMILTLPTCIYHLLQPLVNLQEQTLEQWCAFALFRQLAVSLSEANHAVNFYIYFLSARRFRSRFKELMCKCFNPKPSTASKCAVVT